MRISVFGLGYVGLVTALCHAADGHRVWGVDTDSAKVDRLRRGISPIGEPGVTEHLQRALAAGALTATTDAAEAVAATDAALICVGTPSTVEHGTDLSFVLTVTQEIGQALQATAKPYTVILRSTVPPGATRDRILPELQAAAARPVGDDLHLCFIPEFLRQGSAIDDFRTPPFAVVGTHDGQEPPLAIGIHRLCRPGDAPLLFLNYQEAELLKLACNAYHALKIGFANEIGSLAQHVDADPKRVMDAFAMDTKLNVSRAYLRPGFAFGGSCLPKDVRSLNYIARQHRMDLPVHRAILPSNDAHLGRAADALASPDTGTIGIVGLTFKPDTDDLRESPALRLVDRLLKNGKDVLVHEPEIRLPLTSGANLSFLSAVLPDYRERLVDWPTLRERAHTILITRTGAVPSVHLTGLSKPVLNLAELTSTSRTGPGPRTSA